MKRLLLICPAPDVSLVGKGFFFRVPALGLLRVAALTPPGWEVVVFDERVEPLDLAAEADLVGITATTFSVLRGYQIASSFRQRGIPVVMGGMHVSSLPEEALGHCDSVVVGEAEGLWPTVLRDFEAGRMQPVYRHLNGLPALQNQPVSNWDLYRPKNYLPVHLVETTRGCPMDCEFCSVTSAFGGHYRNRPGDEVISELRGLRAFDGFWTLRNCVFFVDDNIISNRAYARDLLDRLADFKIRWFSQASMNIANDPDILRRCQQSGCVGLFIGFESLSPETLRAVGKRTNRPENYLDSVNRIHDHGIGIDASFVFGFDTDDDGVFDRTMEFVARSKVEVAHYSILTPYPGTRLYHRLRQEGRLLTRDWSVYDTSHVVYRPRTLTPDQLLEGYFRAIKASFSCTSILRRLWGTKAYKNFFYGMNFGLWQNAGRMQQAYRRGAMRIDPAASPEE